MVEKYVKNLKHIKIDTKKFIEFQHEFKSQLVIQDVIERISTDYVGGGKLNWCWDEKLKQNKVEISKDGKICSVIS